MIKKKKERESFAEPSPEPTRFIPISPHLLLNRYDCPASLDLLGLFPVPYFLARNVSLGSEGRASLPFSPLASFSELVCPYSLALSSPAPLITTTCFSMSLALFFSRAGIRDISRVWSPEIISLSQASENFPGSPRALALLLWCLGR